jgi:hypothetical protein
LRNKVGFAKITPALVGGAPTFCWRADFSKADVEGMGYANIV